MTDLLLRDVPSDLSQALRGRAASEHRSIQGEAAVLLEKAARQAEVLGQIRQLAAEIAERNKGRYFRDSTLLIRDDRDTDHGRYPFRYSVEEFARVSAGIRERFQGQEFGDSADITREDRDSDHGHK